MNEACEPSQAPLLSVVAVSRNDNHGGSLHDRMQSFVNGFFAQCRRHGLKAELILVEWNPPADRSSLWDALDWPADFGPATARIITVPCEVHEGFENSTALPLFQMIGKNVGIRRARGRFVLATNIDLLFGDALIRYMRDALRPGTLLRADRYDVPADVARITNFEAVLNECNRRFFRVNTRFGAFEVAERSLLGFNNSSLAAALSLWVSLRVVDMPEHSSWLGRSKAALARLVIGVQIAVLLFTHLLATSKKRRALRPALRPNLVNRWIEAINHLLLRLIRTSGRRLRSLFDAIDGRVGAITDRAAELCSALFSRFAFIAGHPSIVRERGKHWLRKLQRKFWSLAKRVGSTPTRTVAGLRSMAVQLKGSIHKMFRSRKRLVRRMFRRSIVGLVRWGRAFGDFVALLSPGKWAETRRAFRSRQLHTNGCGDFTLLARADWFRMRGYPEWPIFSWHLDSILMFAANANDISEVALGSRYRVFHIDHSSGWSPEEGNALFDRLAERGIPYLNNDDVLSLKERFNRDPGSAVVNGSDWGLAAYDLPDRQVYPGASTSRTEDAVELRSPFIRAAGAKQFMVKAVGNESREF